jgi:hypothetical protein
MSFKRIVPAMFIALLLISTAPAIGSPASTTTDPVTNTDPRAQQLMQRLEEIKDMNKSGLSGSEKKVLRKEVKGIRKEMKQLSGGVYLSVGAIIIVILLLILLL